MQNSILPEFIKNVAEKPKGFRIKKEPEKAIDDPLFKKYAKKVASRTAKSSSSQLRIASGLLPYAGTWGEAEVNHLLKRLSFGAIKAEIDSYQTLGMAAAVDKLFTFPITPVLPYPTPVNYYETEAPDPLGVPLGASYTQSHFSTYEGIVDVPYYREQGIKNWMMGVYINDATSAREKMTDFWYHFIPINFNEIGAENSHTMVHDYRVLLRNNCLGNFKTLIKAIAKAPAMLIYLNGQESYPDTPNENFARELFELFTVGKDANQANQKYTEDDIKAASKIFSGWRMEEFLDPYPWIVAFNAEFHNQEDKLFSSNFGNTLIANQLDANGANEFDLFFDMLFNNQGLTIAKYVCRRLYRFFVYYEISPQTETDIITPLANLFVTNNFNIKPVVEMLFKSEHFYDQANRGVMIKSPIDFVVGIIRTMKINTNSPIELSDYLNHNNIWDIFRSFADYDLEQGIGNVPNVSGWKAYYQAPAYYQIWINTMTIQKREQFIDFLIFYDYYYNDILLAIDTIDYVKQFPNDTIKNPNLLIEALVKHLLPVDIDATFKTNVLKKANLLNFQENDNYWTNAWNGYVNNPTDEIRKKLVEDRLKAVLNVILKLAEFQLM